MRKLILCFIILAAFAPFSRAKQPPLKAISISRVFVYSKLVHQDDVTGAREVAWLREALVSVFRWQTTSNRPDADAIIIIVPHGDSYQAGSSDSCSSISGSLTCNSSDGSSLSVTCIQDACDSDYNAGNYLSVIVATPVANNPKAVRMVWRSDRGAGGFLAHMNVMATDSAKEQDMAFQESVSSLCHAAGIAGRRKCGSLTWKSWKQWVKSSKNDGDVIGLP